MKAAAVEYGVDLRFGEREEEPGADRDPSHGPGGSATVAVGYVFDTEMSDGVFGVLSDRLAPKGHAYF